MIFVRVCSIDHRKPQALFILLAAANIFLMVVFRTTYEANHDSFRVEFLLAPAALLAYYVNCEFTPLEVLWTFSNYLDSVAILPQVYMLSKTGEVGVITGHYIFALGSCRVFYILNWIYRYFFESFYDIIEIVPGCVQTILYFVFLYLYVTKATTGKTPVLPLEENFAPGAETKSDEDTVDEEKKPMETAADGNSARCTEEKPLDN